ncbi:FtsK/SpoIIIE domain-containing protein [Nocardioides sp.]|uniref:FtsK/SpoIIIE domain-containing protein n=1 Tax=Nocardioides sp. TaxID=35761 RepID=UPI002612EEF1|nr:FtsK/SpoIIIE domain-containing protein [Nocardioides sp.]
MPTLPAPPALPPRDAGWLAQLLPLAGSLVSIGVLSAATGHALVAVTMIGATLAGSLLALDQQRHRRLRAVVEARRAYADQLAALLPSPEWTEPAAPPGTDPVGLVLAARALARLTTSADPPGERQATVAWTEPDLCAELAAGVWLDLREAAAGGVGPHGVIVGATGSGKSELLQAIVLSLALRHRPTDLGLLLIDFKGGTALADLAALPHCAGLVTNLAEDDAAVRRMVAALEAELDRRQRVVRSGVGLFGVGPSGGTAGLGALVVVIDEFSELLTAHPDVLDVLVRTGRVGRSLGLHLVLASQRLEEGRLRELDAHLSWRLALRTFTEAESRTAIGDAGAAHLPREPGWALLRTGPGETRRFRIAPATAAFRADAVEAITAQGAPPVTPVWRPAPESSVRVGVLAGLIGAAGPTGRGGLIGSAGPAATPRPGEPSAARLIPLGLADDPVRQRVLTLDPTAGHVAVVGRPGSGKSTLLDALTAGIEQAAIPGLRCHRADALADTPPWEDLGGSGEVMVVLADDWGRLRQERPALEDALVRAVIGEPRVRLILAAHRWADVRPAVRDLLSTRIELRLTDPFDSVFDRRRAAAVPLGRPGWGLIEGEPFLAALP